MTQARSGAGLPLAWSSSRRLRHAADAARLGILAAAAAFLAVGVGAAALKALLVLVPTLAARLFRVHPAFDLAFALALAIEATMPALGAREPAWWDTVSHTLLPLLSGPVLYVGLARVGVTVTVDGASPLRSLLGAVVVTAAAVLALATLWEIVEWLADQALGTRYSPGHRDTVTDLATDTLGAAAGGALVALSLRSRVELG